MNVCINNTKTYELGCITLKNSMLITVKNYLILQQIKILATLFIL